MSQRRRRPSTRRTLGHLSGDGVGGPDRRVVAGRAVGLRAMADGLWPVPALAAGWHRYDKLAVRYEATVHIAAINEWPRHDL